MAPKSAILTLFPFVDADYPSSCFHHYYYCILFTYLLSLFNHLPPISSTLHVTRVLPLSFHLSSSFLFLTILLPFIHVIHALLLSSHLSSFSLLFFFGTFSLYVAHLWMANCENDRAKLKRELWHQNTTATKACERHGTKPNAVTSEQCNTNTHNNKPKTNESRGLQKISKINPGDNDDKLCAEKCYTYEEGMYKQCSARKVHVGMRTTNIETNTN